MLDRRVGAQVFCQACSLFFIDTCPCFTFVCALFHRDKSTACVYDTSPPTQHAFPLTLHYCHCQPCFLARPLKNNNACSKAVT